MRSVFLLLLIVSSIASHAQSAKPKTAAPKNDQLATVDIVVTDMKNKPRKGDEVLLVNETNGKVISVRAGTDGRAQAFLPAGFTYAIKLKSLNDTTNYSSLEIPALNPGEYFTEASTINIQFEPARNFTLNNVHFDTGKPSLRPDSFKELNEIAAYMKYKEDEKYEISGHTDNVGKETDNQRLSQQRADAVKNYLVKKGIDPKRIEAKGYGSQKPVADNSTEEGRQKNRRTELVIL